MNVKDYCLLLELTWPEWLKFPRVFGLSEVASALFFMALAVAILVIAFVVSVTISKRRSENTERRTMAWKRRELKKKDIEEAARKHDGEDIDDKDNEPVDTGINVQEEDEQKSAAVVLGSNLGMSAKKKEEDENVPPEVINGYLQKSNTAPIRPVYSNTPSARAAQKKDLDSDEEELAAKYEPPKKVKPTALKRPTASKVSYTQDEEQAAEEHVPFDEDGDGVPDINSPYGAIVRPVVGSEVANAEVERPAEVSEVTPKIAKTGLEAANEAATAPVKGFAAPKKGPVKRPKQGSQAPETTEDALEEARKKAEALERIEEKKKARLEKKEDSAPES
ncbi:MAG: hypothetical protein J5778_10640 [Clostridiales bacterium]|nr:hypothetical protein [Clostridiales bacterium]